MAKAKKPGLIFRIQDFFLKTLSGDFDETRKFQKRLQASIQFGLAAFRKFLDDEVLLRSASISYAIVVSFVPSLVVVMMVGSRFIDIEAYFDRIADFARMNGLQIDLEPYFNVIREFLRNAGAIGGIGFLILLFSATSVLRNIEDSVNKIWRVTRRRSLLQKISGFILVMVFGPAVLAVGISFAQSILSQFSAPNFRQVRIVQDAVQILGDKHVFLVQNEKGKPFREKNVLHAIQYDVLNESLVVVPGRSSIASSASMNLTKQAPKADAALLKSAVFVDYARTGNREFILTDNGILLTSLDGGATYTLRRFFRQDEERVRDLAFRRIQFLTERIGIIIGTGGLILRTTDGGASWESAFQEGVTANFRQIARMRPGVWIVIGDGSTALVTRDFGASFSNYEPITAMLRARKESLTGIAFGDRFGYVVGEAGLLLVSDDGGDTWKRIPMAESLFFQDVAAAPDGSAIAVGMDGLVKYTQFLPDGSVQWATPGGIADVDLQAVRYYAKENKFIIVGDHYTMMQQLHDSANLAAEKVFKIIQKAPLWRRLVSALGNLLIPFVVIFLLFFLLYKIIPYTMVQTKAAATGAVFTSVSWVIFILLYKFYVTNFSKGTAALYGTLALVPLTLLMLYVSALIVLFGAEIAFFTQYPQLFRMSKKAELDERHKRQLWYGLSILYRLASSFNKGRNDCTTDALIKYTSGDQEEFQFIMSRLVERGYVTETEEHKWLLAMNPDLIEISTLVEDLDPSDYSIPEYNPKDPYMKAVKGYFDQLESSRSKIFRKVTLSRLMQGDQTRPPVAKAEE